MGSKSSAPRLGLRAAAMGGASALISGISSSSLRSGTLVAVSFVPGDAPGVWPAARFRAGANQAESI